MRARFILLVLLAGLCLTPFVQARVLLKMRVYVPLNLVGLGTTAIELAREVEATSDGEIRIKVYGPGKLVPAEEIFNAVNRGQVQAGYITAGYQSGLVGSKAAFFSSIPFGPDAPEYLAWIYHGDGRKLWRAMYDEAGFEVDERLNSYKILKYKYFPGWHQQATLLELLVNKDI